MPLSYLRVCICFSHTSGCVTRVLVPLRVCNPGVGTSPGVLFSLWKNGARSTLVLWENGARSTLVLCAKRCYFRLFYVQNGVISGRFCSFLSLFYLRVGILSSSFVRLRFIPASASLCPFCCCFALFWAETRHQGALWRGWERSRTAETARNSGNNGN